MVRVTLTIPDGVWKALKAQAEKERRTTSNLAVLILVEAAQDELMPALRHAETRRGTGRVVSKSERPKLVIEDELGEGTTPLEDQPPPLDAEGIPRDSAKGKATVNPSRPPVDEDKARAFREKHGK